MNNEETVVRARRGRPSKKPVDGNRIPLPGDIIISRFIRPRNITQKEVAEGLGIPLVCFSAMLGGRIRISAEYALRLSLYFGLPVQFWLGLQSDYDERALTKEQIEQIKAQVKPNYEER
ncbi:MAG: HigA family addiction module antidote protein [Opitutales bacterium]|nr:HigA family addiction module antidote protein [Opitutales bacterium]